MVEFRISVKRFLRNVQKLETKDRTQDQKTQDLCVQQSGVTKLNPRVKI